MEEIDQVGEVDPGFDFSDWIINDDIDIDDEDEERVSEVDDKELSQSTESQIGTLRAPKTPTVTKLLSGSCQSNEGETADSSASVVEKKDISKELSTQKTIGTSIAPAASAGQGGSQIKSTSAQAMKAASATVKIKPKTRLVTGQASGPNMKGSKTSETSNSGPSKPQCQAKVSLPSKTGNMSLTKVETSNPSAKSVLSKASQSSQPTSNVTCASVKSYEKPSPSTTPTKAIAVVGKDLGFSLTNKPLPAAKVPLKETQSISKGQMTSKTVPQKKAVVHNEKKQTSVSKVKEIAKSPLAKTKSVSMAKAVFQNKRISDNPPKLSVDKVPSATGNQKFTSDTNESKNLNSASSLAKQAEASCSSNAPLKPVAASKNQQMKHVEKQIGMLTKPSTVESTPPPVKVSTSQTISAATFQPKPSGSTSSFSVISTPNLTTDSKEILTKSISKQSPVTNLQAKTDKEMAFSKMTVAADKSLKPKMPVTTMAQMLSSNSTALSPAPKIVTLETNSIPKAVRSAGEKVKMVPPPQSTYMYEAETYDTEKSIENTSAERVDREGSPCIAEVMASTTAKDDDDTPSKALDIDTEDISDTEFDNISNEAISDTELVTSNKRSVSPSSTGPPDKKAKLDFEPKVKVVPQNMKILTNEQLVIETKTKDSTGPNNSKDQITTTSVVQHTQNTTVPKAETKIITKRIVRRFHRSCQTTIKQHSSKLLQCLIHIPGLDAPPKPETFHTSVQADVASEKRDAVIYRHSLPATVRQDVFNAVSLFTTAQLDLRHIRSKEDPFTHGISIGQVTQADVDKSLFKENIVSKSAYYSMQFDGQDGIIDLYFKDEDTFLAAMIQIRKTKIGPRYLPVTFFKLLTEKARESKCPKFIRATVIFDQNFSSTAFLATAKAQVWNRPKVEETLSIHNMPGGIPMEFLKQLIPDAITIDADEDDKCEQFSKEDRRILMGVNRKTGNHIMTLFNQVYINGHYLLISKGRTNETDVPNLKEIERKQKDFYSTLKYQREMKANPRDINSGVKTDTEKESKRGKEIVIMQVDDAPNIEKMLVGNSKGWTGPNTAAQLAGIGSEDLSDISDSSDIGDMGESQAEMRDPPRYLQSISPRSKARRSADRSVQSGEGWLNRRVSPSGPVSGSDRNQQRNQGRAYTPVDAFGRSLEMQEQFKTSKPAHSSGSPDRASRGSLTQDRPRTKEDDLRHLITGLSAVKPQTESRQVGQWREEQKGRGGSEYGVSSWEGQQRDHDIQHAEKGTSGSVNKKRGPRIIHRYSPDTELALMKRNLDRRGGGKGKVPGSAALSGISSKSPSPASDSRDRFKRLVEEKLRGLEKDKTETRGGSRQNRGRSSRDRDTSPSGRGLRNIPSSRNEDFRTRGKRAGSEERVSSHGRRGRSRSPVKLPDRGRSRSPVKLRDRGRSRSPVKVSDRGHITRHSARRRSTSPLSPGRRRGTTRHNLLTKKRSSPSPLPSSTLADLFGRGGSSQERKVRLVRRTSLSPLSKLKKSSPSSARRVGRSSRSPITIDDEEEDDSKQKGKKVETQITQNRASNSSAERPRNQIQTLAGAASRSGQRKQNKATTSSANNLVPVSTAGNVSEEMSFLEREMLQEFVKHLLETGDLATALEENEAEAQKGKEVMERGENKLRQAPPIPPPIPPPVAPPLFNASLGGGGAPERMSHMESLANQLAADIQRQQPPQQDHHKQPHPPHQQHQSYQQTYQQQPSDISEGTWAAPTLPTPALFNHPPPPAAAPTFPTAAVASSSQAPAMVSNPPPLLSFMQPPPSLPAPMPTLPQPVVPMPFIQSMAANLRQMMVAGNNIANQQPQQNRHSAPNRFPNVRLNPRGNFF